MDTLIAARRCLPLIDLTSLGERDTPADIARLCVKARTRFGDVAAVCVYPEHVHGARLALAGSGVRVATVVNFPDGANDAGRAERETLRAIAAGADEIDVVFPWRAFLAGDAVDGALLLRRCRQAAAGATLKVILETGELKDPALIRAAADIALAEGADFVKTSTGKVPVNATPEAARVLLEAVRDAGGRAGVKVAGGVRQASEAAIYLALADSLSGVDAVTPARFRFGASALLDDVLRVLASDGGNGVPGSGSGPQGY